MDLLGFLFLLIPNILLNKRISSTAPYLALLAASWFVSFSVGCADRDPARQSDLSLDFQQPPMEVRPSGYWWWLYNNVDKATITRDLEEFREKGLGAVLLVCSGNWSAGWSATAYCRRRSAARTPISSTSIVRNVRERKSFIRSCPPV